MRRFCWWDGEPWWYTYRPGGFDGYRTASGRRLPCATMQTALTRPEMRCEIRRLARLAVLAAVLAGLYALAQLAVYGRVIW